MRLIRHPLEKTKWPVVLCVSSDFNHPASFLRTETELSGKPLRAEKLELFEQGFEIIPFRDLPASHQLAMAWYMAIDGEAWIDIIDYDKLDRDHGNITDEGARRKAYATELENYMPAFIAQYGDVEFGIALWPVNSLIKSIAGDEGFERFQGDIGALRADYETPIQQYFRTSYPAENRWPVIMSSFDDETLQDGWHRFHIYVSLQHSDIPVIFYPQEWHRDMKAEMEVVQPRM